MRIDLFNSAASQITGDANSQPAKTGTGPAMDPGGAGDRTTLSSGSEAVTSLLGQAMNTPQIRQDKVQSLQQAIANGQYQLDPHQIAGAMIDEHA